MMKILDRIYKINRITGKGLLYPCRTGSGSDRMLDAA